MGPPATTSIDLTAKRRRFQAPITSFFPSLPTQLVGDDRTLLSHNHYSAPTCSPTPVVSAKEQASLLSVGMRIRKAISEGYKIEPAHKMSPGSYKPFDTGVGVAMDHAELTPFCGASKSEDYLGQALALEPCTTSISTFTAAATTTAAAAAAKFITNDDGDAFSLPSGSQDSASSIGTGTKRARDHGSADDENDLTLDDTGLDPIPGQTVFVPSVPRQRQVLSAAKSRDLTAPRSTDVKADDFGEAEFLKRRDEVDSAYLIQRI